MRTKTDITYSEFATQKPILYGQILVGNKSKIGSFRPEWQYFPSNTLVYQYYNVAGKKSKGAFTLKRAYELYKAGRLSTNPGDGNPDNYL